MEKTSIQGNDYIRYQEKEALKINSKTGETYIRETIFDKYGRRIGNNDYTDHGRPDIPSHTNPHPNPYNNPVQHGDGYILIHHKGGE